ncbi:MAG: iron-sulfur cluster assembly protein [Gammaproteobacteria bacterium]
MNAVIDEERVYAALNSVMDPELNHGLVELGLIREVDVADDTIHVELQLTTPHCPFAAEIVGKVRTVLMGLEGVRTVEVSRACMGDA